MSVVALSSQVGVREIANVERLGRAVRWVDDNDACLAPEPLVATGTLAVDAADSLRRVLIARMKAGLGSLLVPRFRPCDLADVLDAPSAVEVLPAETAELDWNGTTYRVPGSVVFRTKLHVHKWAILTDRGAGLLAYQPTTVSGRVVLCAASVTLRRVGVSIDQQRHLLAALLAMCKPITANGEKLQAVTPAGDSAQASPLSDSPLSPAELLEVTPDVGPALLLALLLGAPRDNPDEIVKRANDLVGVQLDPVHVGRLALRISAEDNEIQAALVRGGWGVFLRKLRERYPEADHE
jgi:hypothetical protein